MTLERPRWLFGRLRSPARPCLTLHHFGFDEAALRDLKAGLQDLQAGLPADLALHTGDGDVVVVDEHVPHTVPPQFLSAFCDGRPCLTVPRETPTAGMARGAIVAQRLRAALLEQIEALHGSSPANSQPIRPGRDAGSLHSGFDSGFDSRWPAGGPLTDKALDDERGQFFEELRLACVNPAGVRLHASYGFGADVVFDFDAGRVRLDPPALQYLRLQHELPYPAFTGGPGALAVDRELDLTLWDIGAAAGQHALRGAPRDWWHTPVRLAVSLELLARYTKLPLHLELARLIETRQATPSQLRRECRTSVRELRAFLQAGLFIGLLRWGAAAGSAPAPVTAAQ